MSRSDFIVITIGIILLVSGLVIRYFINRRRFNRRGVGGMQHFKNYEQAWLITLLEKVFMGLSIAMILFCIILIGGVILL
jgi:putative heme iron utilization protein